MINKVKFIVECDISKDIKDLDKIIKGRIYVIDGVEDVKVTAAPVAQLSEPQRPQNCGTSYCSCIECPFAAAPTTPKGSA